MSEQQENKTFEEDRTRLIENGDLEIADTFEEDGTRPIAKSPDFLVRDSSKAEVQSEHETTNKNLSRPKSQSTKQNHQKSVDSSLNLNTPNVNNSNNIDADQVLKIDGERPVDSSKVKVVDTFEADGERPIMANKYNIVDTLDIDGERPITSSNS